MVGGRALGAEAALEAALATRFLLILVLFILIVVIIISVTLRPLRWEHPTTPESFRENLSKGALSTISIATW